MRGILISSRNEKNILQYFDLNMVEIGYAPSNEGDMEERLWREWTSLSTWSTRVLSIE